MQIDQFQQSLLLVYGPDALGPFGPDAHAPDEPAAGPPGISGFFNQSRK